MEHETKIKLRKEVLDIAKSWIKTGEVIVRREVVTEEKSIVVPVMREELVIENKGETIRIPVCEERIEIVKQPVMLEEIAIRKHTYQTTQRVEKVLQKEIVHIETIGNASCEEQQH